MFPNRKRGYENDDYDEGIRRGGGEVNRRKDRFRVRPHEEEHEKKDHKVESEYAQHEHRSSERDHLEEQRRIKMAKLRAENEAEERKLTGGKIPYHSNSKDPHQDLNRHHSTETEEKNTIHSVAKTSIVQINPEDLENLEEEDQMLLLLGFKNGFDTSKGKAVEDNQMSASRGAAAKNKARKYRQYMNRKGGFNRPLDKMK